MSRVFVIVSWALTALNLSACGIADHIKAREQMEKSEDAYRNCISENLNDPSKCDPLKAIYERDKVAFE